MTTPGGTFINYAGKKAPPDQAERRTDLLVPDQHGRLVHLVWDKLCHGVVGTFLQFNAPWIPDLKYLKTLADHGFPQGVEWQYAKMLEDNRGAWERWYQDLRRFAAKMNGVSATEAYQAARDGRWAEVPRALLEECGVTPEPEDLILAAMAGNKWVLGFSTVVPDWASPMLQLWEMQKVRAQQPVTADELDKYRDADGMEEERLEELEETFDPNATGGARVPVKRGPGRPKGTRRQVRLSGATED